MALGWMKGSPFKGRISDHECSTLFCRNWKSGQPGNPDCAVVKKTDMVWEVKECSNNYIKGAVCKKVKTRKKREKAGESDSSKQEIGVRHMTAHNTTLTRRHQGSGIKRSIINAGSSINTETQRELTCTSLFGGSSLYWKYDYQVPDTCWSE